MMAKCRKCGWEDTVEYEDDFTRRTCRCFECGARYEVDADYDNDGDGWRDGSWPGREIPSEDEQAARVDAALAERLDRDIAAYAESMDILTERLRRLAMEESV